MPTWQRVPRPDFGKETLAEQGCENGSSKGRRRVIGKPQSYQKGSSLDKALRDLCRGDDSTNVPGILLRL